MSDLHVLIVALMFVLMSIGGVFVGYLESIEGEPVVTNRDFLKRWFSRVTAEGIITGAIPALLLGAWAWHRFIN